MGDAEHLPFEDSAFDAVTNLESSHTYPSVRSFLSEVAGVVRGEGLFLYTDLLGAFGEESALIDNFLAVPGSAVYEQVNSGAWQYRLLRARRSGKVSP